MAFTIDYNESTLKKGISNMSKKMKAMLLMYAATKASQIESKMKINRPWTDRTGMAKITLNTKVSQPDDKTIRITLAHGVEYGVWLELANGKKYAIIQPTVNSEGPRIIEDLDNIMSKIKL